MTRVISQRTKQFCVICFTQSKTMSKHFNHAYTKMGEAIENEQSSNEPEPILLCKCLMDGDSSDQIVLSPRKKKILTTVARTEEYLKVRRISELVRFMLTKVIADGSNHPVAFLESLLNDCMLFRAGHGVAPVLYEDRHLKAVVKSFDPGSRGWLSSGQVRRAFTTLGLTLNNSLDDKISTDVVLNILKKTQEKQLFRLVSAGIISYDDDSSSENLDDSSADLSK